MTTEDKQILIQDLCARLPYGVKIKYHYKRENNVIDEVRELNFSDVETLKYNNEYPQDDWCEISWKPYLRPMSSMTEEEWGKMRGCCNAILMRDKRICIEKSRFGSFSELQDAYTTIDYLNAHHFDYRGMIEKGLALPAPEGMYQQTIKKDIAKKLIDILIYDNDFVNRETPLDESKHYGNWIEKVAEKVCFPNNDLNFYTEDNMNLFAVGDFGEKEELIKEHPELRELDTILNEYFDYLETAFAI